MKSFTTSALILTLLALLLVLVGGFVFLFQAELRLRDQVRETSGEVTSLQEVQATSAAQMADVAATRDTAVEALATAEYGSVLLEGQLVDSEQDVESLTAEIEQLSTDLEDVRADLEALQAETENGPPEAQIMSPEDDDTLSINDEVDIIVIAGDADGLASITVTVDDDELSTFSLSGDRLAVRQTTWETPDTEGRYTIAVSATSVNGTEGEPVEIQVEISDIEALNAAIRADVEAAVVDLRGLPLLEPITPPSSPVRSFASV
ncbi:MAG: Ig-like domain-containing protein [Chloroflexota bacterium]